MGNIAFVSSKRNLDSRGVTALFEKINDEFFNNLWTIEHNSNWTFWDFSYPRPIPRIGRAEEPMTYEHPFWEFHLGNTKRKLSSKAPRPGVQWTYWAWDTFRNECGRIWSGRLSDEGDSGTRAPKPFRTFEEYLEMAFAHFEDRPDLRKQFEVQERAYLPEPFAALGRKRIGVRRAS
jgi:hypothetical protein